MLCFQSLDHGVKMPGFVILFECTFEWHFVPVSQWPFMVCIFHLKRQPCMRNELWPPSQQHWPGCQVAGCVTLRHILSQLMSSDSLEALIAKYEVVNS